MAPQECIETSFKVLGSAFKSERRSYCRYRLCIFVRNLARAANSQLSMIIYDVYRRNLNLQKGLIEYTTYWRDA